jgi:hypothetical protein
VLYSLADKSERDKIVSSAKKDGTYLKAPNGKDTNLNAGQWVTVRTENFKKWFGDWEKYPAYASKVVDENGEPLVVYSGHFNTEMYGEKYIPRKTEAGGFYSSEDPLVASNYSLGKAPDASNFNNGDQYRVEGKNGKLTKKLSQYELSDEQKKKLDELAAETDKYGEYEYGIHQMKEWIENNKNYEQTARRMSYNGGMYNLQNIYDYNDWMGYNIAYNSNNHAEAAFQRQQKNESERILDALGIKWSSHDWSQPGVYPIFLDIRKPIDASEPFPEDLLKALEDKAKYERKDNDEIWSKDYSLKRWVKSIKEGDEYWSAMVPSKALPIIQSFGYDGIKERGTKGAPADERQINWIAFRGNQIKSSTGNKGTFDSSNDNIRYSLQDIKSDVNVAGMDVLVTKLNKAFPGTEVVFATNKQVLEHLNDKYGTKLSIGEDAPLGFLDTDGKIYINTDRATMETPIHEFGEIWAQWAQDNKPGLYEQGIELIKKDEALMAEINDKYGDAYGGNKKMLFNEALVTAIGRNGEKMYENMEPERKKKLLQRLKEWISKLFDRIKNAFRKTPEEPGMNVDGITPTSSMEDFLNAVGKDLLGGKTIADTRNDVQEAAKYSVGDNVMSEVINGFYSPIEKRLNEFKQEKVSANKWLTIIGKGDEAKYTGVMDWLQAKKPTDIVSKSDIMDYMKNNRIEVKEKMLSKEVVGNDIPKEVVDALKSIDNLGFGSAKEAIDSVLNDPDWWNNHEVPYEKMKIISNYVITELPPPEHDKPSLTVFKNREKYFELLVTLPQNKEKPIYKVVEKQGNYPTPKTWYHVVRIDGGDAVPTYYDTMEKAQATVDRLNANKINQLLDNNFTQGHYKVPNVLVHLRAAIVRDAEGRKGLALEEEQSDWGQKGKKEGFTSNDPALKKQISDLTETELEMSKQFEDLNDEIRKFKAEYAQNMTQKALDRYDDAQNEKGELYIERRKIQDKIKELKKQQGRYPLAPFVTDTNAWVKLGLKFALRKAIEEDCDFIAWTTGEQQNERYDLSKQVDEIYTKVSPDGTYSIEAAKDGSAILDREGLSTKDLEELVGKDFTEKIIKAHKDEQNYREGAMDEFAAYQKELMEQYGNANERSLERYLQHPSNTEPETAKKYFELQRDANAEGISKHNMKVGHRFSGVDLKVGGKGMIGFYGSPKDNNLGIIGKVAESMFGKGSVKTSEITGNNEKTLEKDWKLVSREI